MKTKSGLKKRIKITKTGKIKRLQAARSHLRRNKSRRDNTLQNLAKANKNFTNWMSL